MRPEGHEAPGEVSALRVEVHADASGTWWCRPYLGQARDGSAIRPYRAFPSASSREEAQALAEEWAASLTADGSVRSARLADLLDDYNDMRERNGASPNSVRTWRLFARYVRAHLRGALARDLTVADMGDLEQRLLMPKSEGGQGLCRNSVLCVHNYLRAAYNHLVGVGVVESNPMVLAAKPSPERHEAASIGEWDFASVHRAIDEAMREAGDGPRDLQRAACALAAWLALHAGVRVGEACALRRRDVSRLSRYLHVGGTVIEESGRAPWRRDVTKGRRCRNVALTEGDVAVLEAAMRRQDVALGRQGPDAPLVTADGRIMRPTTVSGAFSRMRRSLGLPPGVTFHSLRHTHASWCLAHGVDLKTLSERLGHADEATTLRIYAHVMPGRDAAAARAFEEAARMAAGP